MKTNKSFGERVLNVWAAIVRVLFPRYCVKFLTLKTRKNAAKYLLGAEKERKLIDKLKLSNEEIADRVWSYDTKVALLEHRCFALIDEIKTEKELNAVLRYGTPSCIVCAMRVYTPSRQQVLRIISMLRLETLCMLAEEVPAVFDALRPWEILGVAEGKPACSDAQRWQIALALAEVKSSWAPKFLIELMKIGSNQLGEKGQELMDRFFGIAFAAKEDVSDMMPYFCVIQKKKYARVRDHYMEYKSFAPYFRMMFPQLLQHLYAVGYCSISEINLSGELTAEMDDAYAWLRIGYERMEEPDIYFCLLANMQRIKKNVLPKLYNQLFERMIENAPTQYALTVLYRLADNVLETAIPEKLVVSMEEKQSRATLGFAFPFQGWDEELAIRAIKAMAVNKELPVDRLGELPDNLREVAVTTMEEQSQIANMRGGFVVKLITETQLLPNAEVEFLKLRLYYAEKLEYVAKYRLAESSFRFLVNTVVIDQDKRDGLISRYAAKWGLTESQYCMIMQSTLASSAPFLKKYLRKQ